MDLKITKEDLINCWSPYQLDYFVDVLNGEYILDDARNDIKGLIGSKYDLREE